MICKEVAIWKICIQWPFLACPSTQSEGVLMVAAAIAEALHGRKERVHGCIVKGKREPKKGGKRKGEGGKGRFQENDAEGRRERENKTVSCRLSLCVEN